MRNFAPVSANHRRADRIGSRHTGRPEIVTRQTIFVHRPKDGRADGRIEPTVREYVERIDWQPGRQHFALFRRSVPKTHHFRPWRFGVHMVRRHRRYPAPVVYARIDKRREIGTAEVGRRLDRHGWTEHRAGGRNGPQEFVEIRFRCIRHPRTRLGTEILNDDFLNVAITVMQVAYRFERCGPFVARLADPDQNTGRKRNPGLSRQPDRFQSRCGILVGRSVVRAAAPRQVRRDAFEHQPHRCRHRAQRRYVIGCHYTGIQMRQQAGFRQHETGHFGKVGNGRFMAQRGQFVSRGTVTKLRFVAQRKKRLGTSGCRPPPRDGKHVVGCQVNGLSAPRRMRKGAVMADIPAQFCQRDKYLRAVGHKIAVAVITQARGSRHQIVELRVENIGRHGC